MTDYRENLNTALKGLPLTLNDSQVQAFLRYYKMLEDWNSRMNLTAISGFQAVAEKHFADSLAPWLFENMRPHGRLIDVGSGAGFPGLPLAIADPSLEVVLLDSLSKRVSFLEAVVKELSLSNVHVIHGRAEEAGRDPALRDAFDVSTARAVAALPLLTEYCLPFVKPGGFFLAYKGEEGLAELKNSDTAIRALAGGKAHTECYMLPGTDFRRSLIAVFKEGPTPAAYPRRPGKAQKKPLINTSKGEI